MKFYLNTNCFDRFQQARRYLSRLGLRFVVQQAGVRRSSSNVFSLLISNFLIWVRVFDYLKFKVPEGIDRFGRHRVFPKGKIVAPPLLIFDIWMSQALN